MEEFLGEHISYIMWADDKILDEEWEEAEDLFKKHNLDWEKGRQIIEKNLTSLIDGVPSADEEGEEDTEGYDDEFKIEPAVVPDGVDAFEILKDLSGLALSDGDFSYSEVDMIHRLGKSFGLSEVMISAAMLEVALNSKKEITTSFD
jgi:hypothetical protein